MVATVNLSILPPSSRKFRETNADTTVFQQGDHTADRPALVTVTRTLPTPRKGNPGTQKVTINYRRTTTLDVGLPTERIAPVILKVETSIPVGSNIDDVAELFKAPGAAIKLDSGAVREFQKDLFINGLLPNE